MVLNVNINVYPDVSSDVYLLAYQFGLSVIYSGSRFQPIAYVRSPVFGGCKGAVAGKPANKIDFSQADADESSCDNNRRYYSYFLTSHNCFDLLKKTGCSQLGVLRKINPISDRLEACATPIPITSRRAKTWKSVNSKTCIQKHRILHSLEGKSDNPVEVGSKSVESWIGLDIF
jgi:hypothetical protein